MMAAVNLLEAFLLSVAGVAGFMIYRRVMSAVTLLDGFEGRQVAPLVARMHAVIDDVKDVTATVREDTERVDHAIRPAVDRVATRPIAFGSPYGSRLVVSWVLSEACARRSRKC